MSAIWATADDVLRRASWTTLRKGTQHGLLRLIGCLIVFGLVYGAAMGTYRGLSGETQWLRQIIYSAAKVPLLLMATFAISLPSFFVLNSLLGLRRDFDQSLRAVIATQAGMAVILASFAPLTLLWYASSANYNSATLCNGIMFAAASLTAQKLLRDYYRPLIERNRRHKWMLWGWMLVYSLVAIQMAWLMRPFIGTLERDVEFVRPEAWDNAYVIVFRLVRRTLGW